MRQIPLNGVYADVSASAANNRDGFSAPKKKHGIREDCFFFQAEDGIRDVERSRGLGDVYKRQIIIRIIATRPSLVSPTKKRLRGKYGLAFYFLLGLR